MVVPAQQVPENQPPREIFAVQMFEVNNPKQATLVVAASEGLQELPSGALLIS